MRFAYFDKLSRARQRIYLRSDAIESIGLPSGLVLGGTVARIARGLREEDRAAVQAGCQVLITALAGGYRVPPVRVRVMARRPADGYGELHGLYEPEDEGVGARITVWMR
ncbi:MAG TPA: hypothetical protein VIH36_14375, partial [Casimicrobiaceae bacterium]